MSRKVIPITLTEHDRLKKRSLKFLAFAMPKVKTPKKVIVESHILMIAGERQAAVEQYKQLHKRTYPQRLSRWMHFKKAVWR